MSMTGCFGFVGGWFSCGLGFAPPSSWGLSVLVSVWFLLFSRVQDSFLWFVLGGTLPFFGWCWFLVALAFVGFFVGVLFGVVVCLWVVGGRVLCVIILWGRVALRCVFVFVLLRWFIGGRVRVLFLLARVLLALVVFYGCREFVAGAWVGRSGAYRA